MRYGDLRDGAARRLTLTRQVALLSLIPIVALGFILARVLQSQIQDRVLTDATQSARAIANIGIKPKLNPSDLRNGLPAATIQQLNAQLGPAAVREDLARVKIWNAQHTIVYSDDRALIDRPVPPSDDLGDALAGRPHKAAVVQPTPGSETYSELGLGTLVEVYVPLRFAATGRPAGAFEIYLSYKPIAAALSRDKRTILLLVAIGLALLWAILYRIVANASRRLRRQARENYRLARRDALTGLPNRTGFLEGVARALHRAGNGAGTPAVLMIDLERFKQANNTLGSTNGDRILIEVAARLRASLGSDTLVARLGADEYAVLCRAASGEFDARSTARQIHTSLEAPIAIGGAALNVEASIGIAVADGGVHEPEELLQRADAALARARSSWSRVAVYSRQDSADPEQLILLGEVRGALERGEFVLHYQPKLDLATRRVTGVEALLRWQHPERGLLSPMQFVPAVEQTALMGAVTQYVIDRALSELAPLRKLGMNVQLAVNISTRDLLDAGLPARIQGLLQRHRVSPEMLTVEITESAAMTDPARAIKVLESLRAFGVRVSVDDFGTGNASIQYLATLPADELKIDRSFVTDIIEDQRAEAIVRSTIELARHLGLGVVAEGIESEPVLERASALGCDTAQGYFVARPLPLAQLVEWLTEHFGVGAAQLSAAAGART